MPDKNETPRLTLRQAIALTGDGKSSGVWVHHLPCDDPNEPERLSRYMTNIAIAWYGDAVVKGISPFIDPNPEKTGPDDAEHPDFYRGNVYAVEKTRPTGTPEIIVCVDGGIVSDVYVNGVPSGTKAVVLDVDKEREDAVAVRAEWDRVAADQDRYTHVEPTFYDPGEN